ncbi:hypothetical protein KBT16_26120 [Nostoc sp. CCCryo 231-06]|nr:hypothetical protein [Nostoc sp. CCCryo 231-06]
MKSLQCALKLIEQVLVVNIDKNLVLDERYALTVGKNAISIMFKSSLKIQYSQGKLVQIFWDL